MAGHLTQRSYVDAGLVHLEGEVRDPGVLGHVRVRPGQQHAQVGVLTARRPDFLTVDDPFVTVPHRLRLQPGQVRSGLGLAEQLAPGHLAGDDVAHVVIDLLLRAMDGDGRVRPGEGPVLPALPTPRTWRSPGTPAQHRPEPCPCRTRFQEVPAMTSRRGRGAPTIRRRSNRDPSCFRATPAVRRGSHRPPYP